MSFSTYTEIRTIWIWHKILIK